MPLEANITSQNIIREKLESEEQGKREKQKIPEAQDSLQSTA